MLGSSSSGSTRHYSADGLLGIGLSLVKRLVERHGGTVEAHSAGRGQGSEFIVRLPRRWEEAPAGRTETSVTPTQAARRFRILVVDDNRDSAESLAMLLQAMDHETQTAYDGLEALEVATTFQPEVVLLDLGMPKLNGYDTARRLRERPGRPSAAAHCPNRLGPGTGSTQVGRGGI